MQLNKNNNTFVLKITYKGYLGGEVSKSSKFNTMKLAEAAQLKTIRAIGKDGGINFIYQGNGIKSYFVFSSNIYGMTIHEVESSERTIDVSDIISD